MELYGEGILWYLLLIDCVIYNFLSWSQGKLHKKVDHWLTNYFPLSKGVGLLYLFFVAWTGFLLYRMQIIFTFLR